MMTKQQNLPPWLLLTTGLNILYPYVTFRLKITEITNNYELHHRTCGDKLKMIEGVYFSISYATVYIINLIRFIISIETSEGMITIMLDIYNDFNNTIIKNPQEFILINFSYIYLKWFKRKYTRLSIYYNQEKEP